ncbi:TraB/GumN family protein [Sphingomonas sp. S1-29]|uniref:TraB/GumN family protein n=1 Tax=Sphingomonas sp. S1-29 TaxID=2991074 RepID=UPI00223EE52C|nr:TraB/GumN family protein [Sphingomonas sp. S1-29]UZK68818.1 TraB/GumN family protein [Sphingomonas sp. S1-29]
MLQNAFARLLKIVAMSSALAICVALATPSVAQPEVSAATAAAVYKTGPAMWMVTDKGSAPYLFGTMHALCPNTVWNGPATKNAMATSEEIWFEAESPTDPKALESIIMEFGIDRAKPLSSKRSSAEYATFNEAIGKMGMEIEQGSLLIGRLPSSLTNPANPIKAAISFTLRISRTWALTSAIRFAIVRLVSKPIQASPHLSKPRATRCYLAM